ncbi:hypothetical protein CY34DRAFT_812138 [Suillus luteus UH-Slu-Lm8-n1]|uniref:Unplaced genomic scaffold CY34scaffold_492, whole genome shotgun sequence n=1 Tax=Suillus luteus UH-Slu-Lm8-n1 TaxID=930992 RepID=A0A0C9ZD81_9AGAM|nr:hypothetical protein CY34DRAFT_812138 [Suillus luteus UH-Slu-Lm8-n1]
MASAGLDDVFTTTYVADFGWLWQPTSLWKALLKKLHLSSRRTGHGQLFWHLWANEVAVWSTHYLLIGF